MLFTYFINIFIMLLPIFLLQKFILHSDIESILIVAIITVGAIIVMTMESFLKQLKIIIKNAYKKL